MFCLFRLCVTLPPRLAPELKPARCEFVLFMRFMNRHTPAARSRHSMIFLLTLRTSHALLATTGMLYWHIPWLAWNARARSGDLLSHGARRQHGARVRRVRGTPQLFGASHLA